VSTLLARLLDHHGLTNGGPNQQIGANITPILSFYVKSCQILMQCIVRRTWFRLTAPERGRGNSPPPHPNVSYHLDLNIALLQHYIFDVWCRYCDDDTLNIIHVCCRLKIIGMPQNLVLQLLLPGLPLGVRIPVCLTFAGRIFTRMVAAFDEGEMASAFKEQVSLNIALMMHMNFYLKSQSNEKVFFLFNNPILFNRPSKPTTCSGAKVHMGRLYSQLCVLLG